MKKITAIILALVMLLSLCACGSSRKESYAASYTSSADYDVPMEALAGAEEAYYYEAESGLGMAAAPAPEAKNDSGGSGSDAPEENPSKIIYSADVTLETTGFAETISGVEELIRANGGWIESSSVNGSDYYSISRGKSGTRSANYTIRIPSEKFASVMESFSTLGNVPRTHTYTENVTARYYDVQARLKAYQAQEERLLEMMELAKTVEDIITIESKLTEVRYMIDSFQSSLNNWDRQVSYSTISLKVEEVREYTPEAPVKMSYGEELSRAFTDALKNAGEFFKDLLVFLVSAIPTLVILAILFFVFRPLIKKLVPKIRANRAQRRENRAARKAAKAQAKINK